MIFSTCQTHDYPVADHECPALVQCQLRSDASICQRAANGRVLCHKTSLRGKNAFWLSCMFAISPPSSGCWKHKKTQTLIFIFTLATIKNWGARVWLVRVESLQKTFQCMMQNLQKSALESLFITLEKENCRNPEKAHKQSQAEECTAACRCTDLLPVNTRKRFSLALPKASQLAERINWVPTLVLEYAHTHAVGACAGSHPNNRWVWESVSTWASRLTYMFRRARQQQVLDGEREAGGWVGPVSIRLVLSVSGPRHGEGTLPVIWKHGRQAKNV